MPTQRMKKPGGGDSDTAVMELGSVDIPDVSEQLERLSEAAAEAATEKGKKKQRDKEREEMMRCCGIRI